jgi:hypothetical protein
MCVLEDCADTAVGGDAGGGGAEEEEEDPGAAAVPECCAGGTGGELATTGSADAAIESAELFGSIGRQLAEVWPVCLSCGFALGVSAAFLPRCSQPLQEHRAQGTQHHTHTHTEQQRDRRGGAHSTTTSAFPGSSPPSTSPSQPSSARSRAPNLKPTRALTSSSLSSLRHEH